MAAFRRALDFLVAVCSAITHLVGSAPRTRQIQRDRFRRAHVQCDAEMTTRQMRRWCELDPASRKLLTAAIERLGLSARAHDRILKVSRTIADLGGRETIDASLVAEAVQYRALDRAYFRT